MRAVKEAPVVVKDWTVEAKRLARRGFDALGNLAADLGVSKSSLLALWVGGDRDERDRWFWSFPERHPDGRVMGIKRRYEGAKKFYIPGSKSGLYYAAMWDTLPGAVWLVEGGSDTAAMLTMGVCAIGRPSCLGGIPLLRRMLATVQKPVIVLGEHDEKPHKRGERSFCPLDCKGCMHCAPGKTGAIHTARELRVALRRDVAWCLPPAGFKDVRAWLQANPGASAVDWLSAIEVKGKA